ncbi:hypothetical protein H1C71_041741 [Ictidomys tridecemlineatus]|nr:hypothetical protein H1C71_041741 [Ictidomys tridecemlineatus]KAG3284019.1 hypothetical protein H1C71_041741 [Ictidomys tridecemlineatus]KAG3284020.1 hypothetical protein H1C71_041741 [Ictidomys tridecemlineatus]KAG3284021.1 hypothetical protein H1C71_041741 [Ictidomys tridecemlineatus]
MFRGLPAPICTVASQLQYRKLTQSIPHLSRTTQLATLPSSCSDPASCQPSFSQVSHRHPFIQVFAQMPSSPLHTPIADIHHSTPLCTPSGHHSGGQFSGSLHTK